MKHYSQGFALTQYVLLTGLCAGLFTSVFAWDKLMIAREGKTQYTIVQSDQATNPEKFAVRELTNFLSRVTGASFPVVAESTFSGEVRGIYVGWTKFADQNGINAAKLGEEEWIIRSIGKNLVITGGRPRGTLYAVYEFLEHEVGCHWLDRDAEIIPSRATLELSKLNIQGKPVIAGRNIYTADHQVMPTGKMQDKKHVFYLRNRQSMDYYSMPTGAFYRVMGSPAGCHTFYRYLNASNWFESHPEYFSLNAQGQRVPAKDAEGPGQLCLTNPDVRRIILDQLRKFIARDRAEAANKGSPPPRIYDISQNDVYDEHCRCTNCQAIVAREGGESGPLIDFINAIAEDIENDYPDILVLTYAYNLTQKLPKTLKPRQNVMIRWCDVYGGVDLVRPLSHPYNLKNYEQITGWGKISSHLSVWDYWISYGLYDFPTPYCMIQCIGPDLKLFADMHTETFVAESEEEALGPKGGCNEPGENFTALKYWLGYKQLVNPYQPVEPLIQTFMDGYYGAASSNMNEYLKYLEGRIDKEADFMMVRNTPHNLKYLDLNFFVTAEKLFDSAEALVKPGSLEALHVQKERLIVDGALLYLWPWMERKLAPEAKMPFDHETVISRYETNWRTQSKAFYSEKAQAVREIRVARLAALFRDPKLPEQFRKLPSRDVADFNWLTFQTAGRIFVTDKEAAGEMAILFTGDSEEAHKKPLTFGVTGGATITVKSEEVPQDGKYHIFKIGRINVKKGTTVWAHASKSLGVNVDRLCVTNAADPAVNDWDAYISLKVKGAAYVKGSTETNGVWMDRALLVKPQKGEQADAAELRRQEEEKKMTARRAAPPPQVRVRQSQKGAAGDPLKVDWIKAATGGEWGTILGYSTSRKVEAFFIQDGEYLYVRLTEEVNPEALVNDPGIWGGDDWELFFAPKRGTKPYRQMGVAPRGGHMELAYGESSDKWESGVNVISETGANCWKVSMSFPLSRLLPGGVKPGQTVYVNILRVCGGQGDTLAWSPNFENNFHSLDRLGEIILE